MFGKMGEDIRTSDNRDTNPYPSAVDGHRKFEPLLMGNNCIATGNIGETERGTT